MKGFFQKDTHMGVFSHAQSWPDLGYSSKVLLEFTSVVVQGCVTNEKGTLTHLPMCLGLQVTSVCWMNYWLKV